MIVVTAAFPFVPAELNIAHFASTYVPADVYNRLLRLFDIDSMLVSATDFHSIYASKDGKNTDYNVCANYHTMYINLFKKLSIGFDNYITTDDASHKENVKKAFKILKMNGQVYSTKTFDNVCSECKCHLPKRFSEVEKEKKCMICGNTVIIKQTVDHFFLKLRGEEQYLYEYMQCFTRKDVKTMIKQFMRCELSDWDITRNNNLGVAVPNEKDLSFYIWFDSLVGYYSLAQMINRPEYVHFIGKNIVYYHGIVWPALAKYMYANISINDICAQGFLDFEHSDKCMVDLNICLNKYDADFVRFYIAYKVKDNISDYCFKEDDFQKVIQFHCCKKIGGYFWNSWKILRFADNSSEDENFDVSNCIEELDSFSDKILKYTKEKQLHSVLKELLAYIDRANTNLCSNKCNYPNIKYRNFLKREVTTLLCFLSVFMPRLVFEYSIFENWVPKTLKEVDDYLLYEIRDKKNKVTLNDDN